MRCYVTSDPVQGLALTLERQPGVVVTDLQMPGMTGFELARAIHALDLPSRPLLVAVSGDSQAIADARRAPEYDHALVKPIDIATLMKG